MQPTASQDAFSHPPSLQQELEDLVDTAEGIRWKSVQRRPKLMINSTNDIQREIKLKIENLGTVTKFKSCLR